MKRMPYERPTDYYNEQVKQIDEQLCELLHKRKEISQNNPGFPPFEYITEWANKYGLYEDLLKSLFGSLLNEEHLKPYVDPAGFRMHIPVSKSIEIGDRFFSVPFIRQYNNASVINFNIDRDLTNDLESDTPRHTSYHTPHTSFKLTIGASYECRFDSGGGSNGHQSIRFIVTPALPDNPTGIDLWFKEYQLPKVDSSKELDVIIHL